MTASVSRLAVLCMMGTHTHSCRSLYSRTRHVAYPQPLSIFKTNSRTVAVAPMVLGSPTGPAIQRVLYSGRFGLRHAWLHCQCARCPAGLPDRQSRPRLTGLTITHTCLLLLGLCANSNSQAMSHLAHRWCLQLFQVASRSNGQDVCAQYAGRSSQVAV